MATCYYNQQSSRLEDVHRKSPARDLDDIRLAQREFLKRTRTHFKCLKMLHNRPTLIEYLSGVDDFIPTPDDLTSQLDRSDNHMAEEEYPASQARSSSEYPEQSQAILSDSSQACQSQAFDWASSPSEDIFSGAQVHSSWSTPSNSARSTPIHLPEFDTDIPSFLLDTPDPTPTPGGSGRNSPQNRNMIKHKQALHQTDIKHLRNSPRHRKLPMFDPDLVKSGLEHFDKVLNCCSNDKVKISDTISHCWQTLMLSFQTSEVKYAEETLSKLNYLASEQLILPETVVHMLQNGLMFNLSDATCRLENGYAKVSQLLVNLMRICPNAIPYVIDTMSISSMLNAFIEVIELGSTEDSFHALQFFTSVSQMLMTLIQSSQREQFRPMLPGILLATGVEPHTYESYSLANTMKKLIKTKLIHNTVGTCFERSNVKNEKLVNNSLLLLANALNFTYLCQVSDPLWVTDTLCAFRDSRLDSQLAIFMKGLNRLIKTAESSEHSSQGLMVDVIASRIMEQLQQFLAFYQGHFGQLCNMYAAKLNARPADQSAHRRTSGDHLDLFDC